VNVGQLLANSNISDANISGFVLAAATAGTKPNSDPYLLVSAGNGTPGVTPIPEANTVLPLLAVFALAIAGPRLRRNAAA
jgi:hypothetical protein